MRQEPGRCYSVIICMDGREVQLKSNIVLVDCENVQLKNISLLTGGQYMVRVFFGANQPKIPVELTRALLTCEDADCIPISGSGRNALDFHIAYYIGRLAAGMPDACFHIVSNDTGFDPLIRHLRSQGIVCLRSKSIADIPLHGKVGAVVLRLIKFKDAKPRTLKTLRNAIKTLFATIEDDALEEVISQLTLIGAIKVADGKVEYEGVS
jgi:PIN domain